MKYIQAKEHQSTLKQSEKNVHTHARKEKRTIQMYEILTPGESR